MLQHRWRCLFQQRHFSVPTLEQNRGRRYCRDSGASEGPRYERLGRTEGVAETIRGKGVEGGPEDASRGVVDEKPSPRHPSRTGEKGRVRAKDRNEPTEEDDLGSVTIEEVSNDLELRFVQSNDVSVAADQSIAADPAEHEADVVAHNGRRGGNDEEDPDREVMAMAGIERRRHQDGLARERHTKTFHRHEEGNGEVPVGHDEMGLLARLNIALQWRASNADRVCRPGRRRHGSDIAAPHHDQTGG